MARIWVAVLNISPRVAQKIVDRHGVQPDDVRRAIVCVPGLRFAWDDHVERGWRALIKTSIRRREALIVVYPVDEENHDGEWNLGSAYFIRRR